MAGRKSAGLTHRSFAVDAERFRHGGEVDRRIIHVRADTGVFHGTLAELGDLDAVLFGIVVRLIVVHDHQERDAMLRRGPERARSHQHVAVGLDRQRQLAVAFERQSRADRARQDRSPNQRRRCRRATGSAW